MIVGAGTAGHQDRQAGNSWTRAVLAVHMWNVFFLRETLVLLLRPFN